jgi:hypothetical protein
MGINQHLKNNNLINLSDSDMSRYIYKIMPLEHLILMLSNRTLALAKTSSWEDVYENFLSKQKFEFHGKDVTMEHLGTIIFGQCWSLSRDSDALWRIYSQDKKSVRIRTTVQKLYDAVHLGDGCAASTFIGKVDYKSPKKLNEWIINNSPISMSSSLYKTMVHSLFLKRNSFSHEREVRVIYQPAPKHIDATNNLKIYDIDPLDFIEQITFDSRADMAYVNSIKDVISKYKFPLRKVNKSALYDFKPMEVRIVE